MQNKVDTLEIQAIHRKAFQTFLKSCLSITETPNPHTDPTLAEIRVQYRLWLRVRFYFGKVWHQLTLSQQERVRFPGDASAQAAAREFLPSPRAMLSYISQTFGMSVRKNNLRLKVNNFFLSILVLIDLFSTVDCSKSSLFT